ncbi:MAG: energy-coupling factor transporter transmembrane component T family protein [Anaerolineae bacterium]
MSEFEFQRFLTIGQHLPTGSVIHRLDPRTRLVCGGILLITITLAPSLMGLVIALVVLLALILLARIPMSYALKGLIPPLPFIAFLALLQILFAAGSEATEPLWTWWIIRVSAGSLLSGARLLLRFSALILTVTLFSATTSVTETVRGLESLLSPLAHLGLPVQDLVLLVQVALRFLPLLAREAERIAKSQASRGAEWGTGKGGLLHKIRQALPILVPLFLISLQRAESMAVAMEARGYRSTGRRTSYVSLKLERLDAFAMGIILLITLIVLAC